MAKIDLAAHIDHIRNGLAVQHMRDLADRPHVGRDVLAFRAIAPRCRLHETALLIADRDGKPVDLWLGRNVEHVRRLQLQETAHALNEIVDVAVGESIAE